MINSVVDLIGDDVERVMAIFDSRGTPVEINSYVSGRFKNGVMFSLAGAGDSIQCFSEILIYGTTGVLKTGIWGGSLMIQTSQEEGWQEVEVPPSRGDWEQFLLVRRGDIPNPSPPEIGLRMAHLWDAIKLSAKQGGEIIRISNP